MKGLELAERYFQTYGMPMIKKEFPIYAGRIACGLVGDGSECLGFDDEISRDHDWGHGFCLWLTSEDFAEIGSRLQEEYDRLPGEFEGIMLRSISDRNAGRVGVFEIGAFYRKFLGLDHIPERIEEWMYLPEQSLATATNGKVFYDPLGDFSAWRARLLDFYPEDVRLKKMASRCMTIAQSGQYNLRRVVLREEYFAAKYAETKFCSDVISLIFLINKRYTPFYKWMHRALKDIPILGEAVHLKISDLIALRDYNAKLNIVENICTLIIDELRREGLTNSNSDFLADHGPIIHSRIKNTKLRERDVWAD